MNNPQYIEGGIEYTGSQNCIKCKILMDPLQALFSEAFEPKGLCDVCRNSFSKRNMKDRL